MSKDTNYVIHTDVRFGPLEHIDVSRLVGECEDEWFNQTLCAVNESVVRLGVLKGEFHWHKHDHEDEFFYVVDGTLYVDLEGKTVELNSNQAICVSKGVSHRTRAPEKVVVLMMATKDVVPTGD